MREVCYNDDSNKCEMHMKRLYIIAIAFISIIVPHIGSAATDGVYTITVDNVGFAGGELSTDGTYGLMDTIGEPVVGIGVSEDYTAQAGFWYMVNNTLSLVLDSNIQDLGSIAPGVPNTGSTLATVTTDSAGGYDLLISQDHDLLHAGDSTTTIPAFTGSIATPSAWTDGTDVGLGFTVTDGTDVEAKWGVTPDFNYAAIPTTDTVFHEKVGYTSGGDDTTVGYQIDVVSTQKSGTYTNTVTVTAIAKL